MLVHRWKSQKAPVMLPIVNKQSGLGKHCRIFAKAVPDPPLLLLHHLEQGIAKASTTCRHHASSDGAAIRKEVEVAALFAQ
jgi:hypothetical protein